MIELNCPHCAHQLRIDDKFRGQRGACKHCGGIIEVPIPVRLAPPPSIRDNESKQALPTRQCPACKMMLQDDGLPRCGYCGELFPISKASHHDALHEAVDVEIATSGQQEKTVPNALVTALNSPPPILNLMQTIWMGGCLVFVGLCCTMSATCVYILAQPPESVHDLKTSAKSAAERSKPSSAVAAMPALAQAELAFVGGYKREQIKERLDLALQLYGMPVTEENYSRAAKALVALRQMNGTPEMAILDYMIRNYVPGVKITFPDAAGISSAFLKVGDK